MGKTMRNTKLQDSRVHRYAQSQEQGVQAVVQLHQSMVPVYHA